MLKFIFVVMFGLFLVGCAGTSDKVVEKTTTQYVTLDDSWLQDCPSVPPPDTLVYTKATLQQRIDMLSAVYIEQAKINAQCRIATREARKYNALKRGEQTTVVCKERQCQ